MSKFRPAKRRVKVSVGDSVRIVRELQELSQNQLAKLTGIPQTTISAIENGRVRLGVRESQGIGPGAEVPPCRAGVPGLGVRGTIRGLTMQRSSRP